MDDFARYHALGNDYIVIDPHHVSFSPTPDAVRLICDRHFGVGSDGILFGPIGDAEAGSPVELRIFNPDGSEAEKSGNGLRIFALYLAENYIKSDEFTIRTIAGNAPVKVLDLANGVIRVDMGRPAFDAADIPVLGIQGAVIGQPLDVAGRRLTVTCVSMGNPHTVVPLPEISADLAQQLGPAIERHPRFPRGCNVQLLRVIDKRTIQIEIWERGAGYTLASGSSSCAAASAARALGLIEDTVEVVMPGGSIEISFAADGRVAMTGPAQQIATGRLAAGLRRQLGFTYR